MKKYVMIAWAVVTAWAVITHGETHTVTKTETVDKVRTIYVPDTEYKTITKIEKVYEPSQACIYYVDAVNKMYDALDVLSRTKGNLEGLAEDTKLAAGSGDANESVRLIRETNDVRDHLNNLYNELSTSLNAIAKDPDACL